MAWAVIEFLLHRDFPRPGWIARLVRAAILGAAVWIACGTSAAWWIALAAFAAHICLSFRPEAPREWAWQWFIAVHLMGIGLLLAVSWVAGEGMSGGPWLDSWPLRARQALALIAGVILVCSAGGEFVGLFTQDIRDKVVLEDILPDAGRRVGVLERFLILALVLVGKPEGIAFLVAAKSVFRFGDLSHPKDRARADYILVGTLASFAYAVTLAYATRYLLSWAT